MFCNHPPDSIFPRNGLNIFCHRDWNCLAFIALQIEQTCLRGWNQTLRRQLRRARMGGAVQWPVTLDHAEHCSLLTALGWLMAEMAAYDRLQWGCYRFFDSRARHYHSSHNSGARHL